MRNIKVTNVVKESTNRLQKIMEPSDHINKIIENTFAVLQSIYDNQQEEKNSPYNGACYGSRIIFPKYSKNRKTLPGETRFSEQELRFTFVEQFNLYCAEKNLDWFYSVETPTTKDYGFKGDGERSAAVDLTIHNNDLSRLALIEFKALNPAPSCFKKDFTKLSGEMACNNKLLTYFVMYIKAYEINEKKPKKDTIHSLSEKVLAKDPENNNITIKNTDTKFYCYVLSNNQEKWIINEPDKDGKEEKLVIKNPFPKKN